VPACCAIYGGIAKRFERMGGNGISHTHLFFPLLNIDESGVVFIHKGPHGCGKLWRREKEFEPAVCARSSVRNEGLAVRLSQYRESDHTQGRRVWHDRLDHRAMPC